MKRSTETEDLGNMKFGAWLSPVFPFLGQGSGRLHLRNDLHLMRKAWHLGMGLVISIIYLAGIPKATGLVILGCLLGLDLLVETARLKSPALNELVMRFWGPVMRKCEVDRWSGTPYYLASAVLAVAIFPKPVAVLSILFLAVGDPVASLFGIAFGDRSIRFANGKSLIGTAAGVVTCGLVSLAFLAANGVDFPRLAIISLVGAFAGGLAEHLPFEIDDNFSIPMVSGFMLWLSFILLGA